MKAYRNVYFSGKKFNSGTGKETIYYYGEIFQNATLIKDFFAVYDSTKDILINCNTCAMKKYKNFVHIDSDTNPDIVEVNGTKYKVSQTKKTYKTKKTISVKEKAKAPEFKVLKGHCKKCYR